MVTRGKELSAFNRIFQENFCTYREVHTMEIVTMAELGGNLCESEFPVRGRGLNRIPCMSE